MPKTNDMQLVEVIIPVYNVEEYLSRCIDSILQQSYQNIRIWLVDDGSIDGSGYICDSYAKETTKVIAIHKSNGGLSSARNEGLNRIKQMPINEQGAYVSFVDSDDWVEPEFIKFLVNLLESTKSDIAQCGHYVTFSDSYEVDKNKNHSTSVLNRVETLESMCRNEAFDVTSWNKLYKMKLFENIRFPDGMLYEDTATTYKLVAKADRFAVNMTPLYHYMQRYNSIANGRKWSDSKLDLIAAGDQMAEWVCLHYPSLKKAALEKRVYVRLSTLSQMVNTSYIDSNKADDLRRFVVKHAKQILLDSGSSKRDKLGVIVILFGLRCYRFVWSLYYKIHRRRI